MPLTAVDLIRLRRRAKSLFNIEEGTPQQKIKKIYRKLANENHSDKNPSDLEESTKMMAEISNAYKALSTPKTEEEEHIERFYHDFI